MDPRQRLMLQAVWTAVEDAGEDPLSLRGTGVGVFVGATGDDFARLSYRDLETVDGHTLTGVAPSVIANRVSYVFGLTGPSEVVDTACSSSLVALHRAVSAIGAGDCDAAVVGGVSLMLDAGTDLALERVGMLSDSGRCWTFDARADGYARGEGVGVVYLKTADRARIDGNRVHCRIIGSAVNHSGRTTSLTAPSPAAQRDVIRACHRRAGVDPHTIGMIEAHGTGTALGDPIEARGLVDAFREPGAGNGQGRPHCALTAVKTNIGHLEAASGIAGFIKAALAVRRGVVPPLAGFGVANELVDLAGSPIFLCTAPAPWPTGPGGPRRAGVSSFGFGGANAHVLVEFDETLDGAPDHGQRRDGPHLLVASGVDRPALRRRVADLLGHLDRQAGLPQEERDPLDAVSHTTLAGRPALSSRLACVADTIDDARTALRAWLAGNAAPPGSIIDPGHAGEPGQTALHALAREWTAGRPVDWAESIAWPAEPRRRVALPTYPFATTSHWPAHLRAAEPDATGRAPVELSDHAELIDAHRVGGRPVLPAAVLLAAFQRIAHRLTGRWAVHLTDVRFSGAGLPVPTALSATWERVEAGWHVGLRDQDDHTRATATLGDEEGELGADPDEPPTCGRELDSRACYERLSAAGVDIGPPLRGLERVRVTQDWCSADLLDPAGADPLPGLAPALLDGALQAALVWQLATAPLAGLPVPTRIASVTLPARSRNRAAATVRADQPAVAGRPRVTGVTITDERHRPVARLSGLRAALSGQHGLATTTLLVRREGVAAGGSPRTRPESPDVVLVGGARLAAELERRGLAVSRFAAEPGVPVVPGALTVVELGARDWRVDSAVLLETVRAVTVARPAGPATVLAVHAAGAVASTPEPGPAVAALARTVRLEHPGVLLSSIAVPGTDPAHLADAVLAAVLGGHHQPELAFDPARGDLRTASLAEAGARPHGSAAPRDRGGYLITGGLGGIGVEVGRELLVRHGARLVLCGRSPADDARVAERLGPLRAAGEVHYVPADLTNAADVDHLVRTARSLIGPVHGVLHCAGTLHDRLLAGCDVAEALAVTAPKLAGAMHLDLATADEEPDFFALFSSLAATTGAVGQGAYGLANGWLESFARDRATRRRGRTVAIGWGPWDTDGMRLPAGKLAGLASKHGLVEFDNGTGFDALTAALRVDAPVVVAVRGDPRRLTEWLTTPDEPPAPSPPVAAASAGDVERTRQAVLAAIAAESGLAPDEIDPDAEFEDYGLDSALTIAVTERLAEEFGELPVTLLYEHRTLDSLATHLAERHPGDKSPVPVADRPAAHAGDIAVIGMSGRFPLAADLAEFWRNLVGGRDCVGPLPADRWAQDGSAPPQWGGFLADWNRFDHTFFAVSRTEAEMMDPQERLFLECAYHALEDAGYPPPVLAGSPVGVYAGVMWGQYQLYGADTGATASSYGSIAHRVSHFLDLTGPSIALDTMCSSSLTAIHLACQSLRAGQIPVAIVGGVNVDTHPAKHRFLVRRRFASPDGRTRAFGAGGQGYVPGEGVAAVVLKPLRDALADGDRVHGVIKGSAINHDGHTRGLTVPNPTAQADVITAALADADVDASTVSYVETHGTGTALGDPIEVRALTAALGRRARPCAIGSVKPNIGHLESAAGVAGLIKVLLQFRHRVLVPSLHADPPNEHIDFAATPLRVQAECADWTTPTPDTPRRAGVSSFGAGGANAHLVVEEPPGPERPPPDAGRDRLVVLSAVDSDRLVVATRSLLSWLRGDRSEHAGGPSLLDVVVHQPGRPARHACPAHRRRRRPRPARRRAGRPPRRSCRARAAHRIGAANAGGRTRTGGRIARGRGRHRARGAVVRGRRDRLAGTVRRAAAAPDRPAGLPVRQDPLLDTDAGRAGAGGGRGADPGRRVRPAAARCHVSRPAGAARRRRGRRAGRTHRAPPVGAAPVVGDHPVPGDRPGGPGRQGQRCRGRRADRRWFLALRCPASLGAPGARRPPRRAAACLRGTGWDATGGRRDRHRRIADAARHPDRRLGDRHLRHRGGRRGRRPDRPAGFRAGQCRRTGRRRGARRGHRRRAVPAGRSGPLRLGHARRPGGR